MNPRAYDVITLLALGLITIGVTRNYGGATACIVLGALMLALNVLSLILARKR